MELTTRKGIGRRDRDAAQPKLSWYVAKPRGSVVVVYVTWDFFAKPLGKWETTGGTNLLNQAALRTWLSCTQTWTTSVTPSPLRSTNAASRLGSPGYPLGEP